MALEDAAEKTAERPSQPKPVIVVTAGLAVIVPTSDKFTCVLDGQVIGTSKHPDYWEYHVARGDASPSYQSTVTRFIRLSPGGSAVSVIDAVKLRESGRKSAELSCLLCEDDLVSVRAAIDAARQL